MRRTLIQLSIALLSTPLFSQTTITRDKEIEQMVKEVNADSLQSYIKTMVGFGTRHTLSTQRDANRGIGAAKKWVLKKFNEFSKQSTTNCGSRQCALQSRQKKSRPRYCFRKCDGYTERN